MTILKFAGDKFDTRRAEIIADHGNIPHLRDKVSFYAAKNVFYLKETARWSHIVKNEAANDISAIIDKAMADIENDNDALKGALP